MERLEEEGYKDFTYLGQHWALVMLPLMVVDVHVVHWYGHTPGLKVPCWMPQPGTRQGVSLVVTPGSWLIYV